jgi:hypothetical protein
VIESIMFVALGFLAASLITLVLLSAVWHRAVRLTTRRVEGAIPVSMAEIQADKDQLRAEFAMSTRRLENGVEQLKLKTTEQLAEISRKSEAIRVLKEEVDQKTARVTAFETQERTLRDQLRSTEAELNLKSKALHEAEAELATKSTELAQAARTIADKSVESDSRRVEIVALEIEDAILERKVAATEERLAEERKFAEQNAHVLSEERDKVAAMNRNVSEMEGRLAAGRDEAESLSRTIASLEAESRRHTELAQAARTIADKSDKNGAAKSTYLDEENPDGAKESTAPADEHSGRAIAKEQARWARLLDNSSHYGQHFSQSSEFGTLGRLGFVVAIAAGVVFLVVETVPNLWSFSSGFAVQASKTSEPPPSPAPQLLAMQAGPRGIGDEVSLSPLVRGASNDDALLTSGLPNIPEPELPPPPEPAPVVLDIPVPAVTATAETPPAGTATYQVGGYAVRQLDRDEAAVLAKRGEEFIAEGKEALHHRIVPDVARAAQAASSGLMQTQNRLLGNECFNSPQTPLAIYCGN